MVWREVAVRSSGRAAAEVSRVCLCADLMRDEEAEVGGRARSGNSGEVCV